MKLFFFLLLHFLENIWKIFFASFTTNSFNFMKFQGSIPYNLAYYATFEDVIFKLI